MDIQVISIFPQMFEAITEYGVTARAVKNRLVTITSIDLREFSDNKHRTIDDRPYGGGPGMVMMVEPIAKAIEYAKESALQRLGIVPKVVYLSPQGIQFNHARCVDTGKEAALILLAGRYEGIDQRVIDLYVDEQWSIGDYVLSGGELACMVVVDAIVRQLPEVLGNEMSAEQDSFAEGLLDCPHYSRPEQFAGINVPSVLLSGDHQAIQRWRKKQALGMTWQCRQDLLQHRDLDETESELLNEYLNEIESRTSSGGVE